MKILHTADLHLGKTLYETAQFDRQKKMLDDIREILTNENYAALIIAGDVYDRSIPPAEAISLFDDFLSGIHKSKPELAVMIIPGNHDSAERLSFGASILQSNKIYIASNAKQLSTPIIISQNEEKVQFFLLPFLHLGSFSHLNLEKKANSQAEMAKIAAEILKQSVDPNLPSVLVAHLFTLGGTASSSERAFLGTAEYITPALFDFFSYTALGHLHKFQKVSERIFYSGAPLTYAFDESDAEKVVLSVDIDCKQKGFPVNVEKIPITPLRKMNRLEGSFYDFFNGSKYDEYKNDFLEITLTDNTLIQNPMSLLQKKFPHLLNLQQKAIEQKLKNQSSDSLQILKKNIEDADVIFENFLAFQKTIEVNADDKKNDFFKNLFKEMEAEQN